MPSTVRDLTALTIVADDDQLLISDTSAPSDRDKRISRINLIGTSLSGGGSIATGGNAVTIPASGPVVIRSGTPSAGHVAGWLDNNLLQDGGFALSDIGRLSVQQTYTAPMTVQGFVTLNNVRSGAPSIADDTALAIATGVPSGGGMILFSVQTRAQAAGMAVFRHPATTYCTGIAIGTDSVCQPGVLTGTTGTDGKLTIGCAADGNLYIENRLGSSITFRYLLMF